MAKTAYEEKEKKEELAKNMQRTVDRWSLINNIIISVLFIVAGSLAFYLSIKDFNVHGDKIPKLDWFLGCFLIFDALYVLVPAIILIILITKLGSNVFKAERCNIYIILSTLSFGYVV